MLKLFNFNLGVIIATIYLVLFLIAIIELNASRPDPLSGLGLLFLTAPWSFILLKIFNESGVLANARNPFTFYTLIIFCSLINAFILYFLGNLIVKVLKSFRQKEEKLQ